MICGPITAYAEEEFPSSARAMGVWLYGGGEKMARVLLRAVVWPVGAPGGLGRKLKCAMVMVAAE